MPEPLQTSQCIAKRKKLTQEKTRRAREHVAGLLGICSSNQKYKQADKVSEATKTPTLLFIYLNLIMQKQRYQLPVWICSEGKIKYFFCDIDESLSQRYLLLQPYSNRLWGQCST